MFRLGCYENRPYLKLRNRVSAIAEGSRPELVFWPSGGCKYPTVCRRVGQMLFDEFAESQSLIQFPYYNQTTVGSDPRSLKSNPQKPVERQLKCLFWPSPTGFTPPKDRIDVGTRINIDVGGSQKVAAALSKWKSGSNCSVTRIRRYNWKHRRPRVAPLVERRRGNPGRPAGHACRRLRLGGGPQP